MSRPSTLSSQQVVADPSGGGGGAPGSVGAGGAGLAPADSLAGKAVFEMKMRNFRFCFIGLFSASYKIMRNKIELKP